MAKAIYIDIPQPSKTQWKFMNDGHKYLGYGGARGGGKSWVVRVQAISYCLQYPGISVIIIRRSYPELRENHIRPISGMVPKTVGIYNDSSKEMRFKNGSRILFRYCARESDLMNFQGLEADIIYIDEATQLEEIVFRSLTACLRGVNPFPKRIICTCNPGGVGHAWVKRLFLDRRFTSAEKPEDYAFIASRVTDNVALMKADPDYLRQLEALPERKRRAWLEGDWNALEGQFFSEFEDNPDGYDTRRWSHVINPFEPPVTWRICRSFDFGYAKPYSAAWWAVSPDNTLYRMLELYGCTNTPNEGVRQTPDEIFSKMAEMEREHPWLKGRQITGVADPSIWDASRGVSVADTAAKHGIYFSKGENNRLNGWAQVHNRLTFDNNGTPTMYVFTNCAAFRRTIPELIHSETRPEDLNTEQEDHVADEVRYMCMMNPMNPPQKQPEQRFYGDDPLNMRSSGF